MWFIKNKKSAKNKYTEESGNCYEGDCKMEREYKTCSLEESTYNIIPLRTLG